MGFFDNVKNLINLSDEQYYDDNLDGEFDEPQAAPPRHKERSKSRERASRDNDRDFDNFQDNRTFSHSKKNYGQDPDKVVNIHTTAQLQVVLVKPDKFEDVSGIADNLNAKRTVVLNLESAQREIARRLVDFLSGVAYANNGQIQRVANSTYIITPYNVDLMGDLLDELENNGMFF